MSFTNKELQKILKRFPSDARIAIKIKDDNDSFAAETVNATLSSDGEWVVEIGSKTAFFIVMDTNNISDAVAIYDSKNSSENM